MISLAEYMRDPCGMLSIPYWKAKGITVPEGIRIVHDRNFAPEQYSEYEDARYFRIMHDLNCLSEADAQLTVLQTINRSELDAVVQMINACYTDLQVSSEQLTSYINTPTYAPALWVWALDQVSGERMGCGIAAFDAEAVEISLEWIQVLPQYRRRGVGQAIVCELLRRKPENAHFATVSGKLDSVLAPEALYRKCGFAGDDVWHILRKSGK